VNAVLKAVGAILAMLASASVAFAQDAQPAKRTIVPALKRSPYSCEHGIEGQFLDDTSLLISSPICIKGGVKSNYQIAIANLDGTIRHSVILDDSARYLYVGPPGYIFVPGGSNGWLIFDTSLNRLGNVPIQQEESEGGIVLSPSRTAVALIFTGGDGYSRPWRYFLLAGKPLENKGQFTTSAEFPGITDSGSVDRPSPAKATAGFYVLSQTQFWFFDKANHQLLTRRSSSGSSTVLPDASWLAPGDAEVWCSGQLSVAEPRRFLAHCEGNTSPFGRMLPIGWGHNRFIVYALDGKILYKLEAPSGASVAISPNGHVVAVAHEMSVDFYTMH
jgi:hypothetical protein